MNSDCYEKGHTPRTGGPGVRICAKCLRPIMRARVNGERVWHTQAELDRLWKGVDREAASDVGGRHSGG